jgi:hypothetical protein
MLGAIMGFTGEVLGSSPPRFRWGDAGEVRALAAEVGATARVHDRSLAFTAASPEAFLTEQEQDHPTLHWARGLIAAQRVDPAPMRDRALAALREHNEDPAAFLATSRYHVIELRRT